MKKIHRLMLREAKKLGATIVNTRVNAGHFQVTIALPSGTQHRLVTANSPTVVEHSVNNFAHDVRRLIRAETITRQPRGTE